MIDSRNRTSAVAPICRRRLRPGRCGSAQCLSINFKEGSCSAPLTLRGTTMFRIRCRSCNRVSNKIWSWWLWVIRAKSIVSGKSS